MKSPLRNNTMTPEQQQIAIAEACGWKGISPSYLVGYAPWRPTPYSERVMGDLESIPLDPLPDYLNDLNAMHDVEDTMGDPQLWTEYDNQLASVMDHVGWKYHATAAQRAEAFLKTLNLWTP